MARPKKDKATGEKTTTKPEKATRQTKAKTETAASEVKPVVAARVVETTPEAEVAASAPAKTPAPTPLAAPAVKEKAISKTVFVLSGALHKLFSDKSKRPMTKNEIENHCKQVRTAFVTPTYGDGKTFVIKIHDGGCETTIPKTGAYTHA